MDSRIEEIKRHIVESYCSSVAVIDDDAITSDHSTIGEDFRRLLQKCNENAILCNFQHYPKERGSPRDPNFEKHFNNSLKIAQKADVVILDWFLGNDDEGPAHSIELLKELLKDDSLRFVLIYTAKPGSVIDKLASLGFDEKGSASIKPPTEEDESPQIVTGEAATTDKFDILLSKADRFFISIKEKNKIANFDIIEAVYGMLYSAFPDLLHWGGLELSTKIKESIPKILAKLPKGTDAPLVYQRLHTDTPDEVSSQVAEIILRELTFNASMNPIQIVSDVVLDELLPTTGVNPDYSSDDALKRDEARKTISKNAAKGSILNLKHGIDLHNATLHEKWCFLRECFFSFDLTEPILTRGAVLRFTGDKTFWLCSTPACDLYRLRAEKGDSIHFIRGEQKAALSKTTKNYFTQTYVGEDLIVEWDPLDVQKRTVTEDISGFPKIRDSMFIGYELIGYIKPEFVDRILQRTWVNQTRIAIDIPELVRAIRSEK